MKAADQRVEELKIAYIGGGSRNWAWTLMKDLALEPALSGTVALYDIDHKAAAQNALIGNSLAADPRTVGTWHYEAVPELPQALAGADFVILSILPATFTEMQSDVHTPEAWGIYQSVGDTVGPGGVFRAMRTLPIYLDFAQAIRKHAPGAWVINYTNPMTLCTRMLYKEFPAIKAFGCCHEVFHTQNLLSRMLADLRGLENVSREEILVNVLGINHFTWIDRASYRGTDLMPLYREFTDKYYASGFRSGVSAGASHNRRNTYFTSAERVKFDLFRRYGLIAAAGDRHLAEFCPPWYLKDPQSVADWKFALTPVSWRIEENTALIAQAGRLAGGEETMEVKASDEEGVRQIKALLGLGDLITNVNIPNKGQLRGVGQDAVVETNARFSFQQLTPLLAGSLPPAIGALVQRHVLNQEALVEAFMHQDLSGVFNVFCNDPLVNLSLAECRRLFGTMQENTSSWLPAWCRQKL